MRSVDTETKVQSLVAATSLQWSRRRYGKHTYICKYMNKK